MKIKNVRLTRVRTDVVRGAT